jgi:hypothetical protein
MKIQDNFISLLNTKRSATIVSVLVALFANSCITSPSSVKLYSSNYLKGMNVFFMSSRNCYRPVEYENTLNKLLLAGVNTVFIITFYYVKDEIADSIFATKETVPDSILCKIIEHTRAKGIEPILKPHIDLMNSMPRYLMKPTNMSRWIGFYKDILLRYIEISNTYGLNKIVIGTEINNIADCKEFHALIRDTLRHNYNGELLYASSFDHFLSSSIWSEVDAIGVNAYFNLCQRDDCLQADLVQSWNYWLNIIDRISISKKKPVFITEIGYYSRDGCAINPGDWSKGGHINFDEQAQAYEALLCQAYAFNNIKGIFWWQWELNNLWENDSSDYTPNNKPAEQILRKFWNN